MTSIAARKFSELCQVGVLFSHKTHYGGQFFLTFFNNYTEMTPIWTTINIDSFRQQLWI